MRSVLAKTDLWDILDTVNRCLGAQTFDDVGDVVNSIKNRVGVDGAIVGCAKVVNENQLTDVTMDVIGSSSPQWAEIYQKKNYAAIDPVVRFAFQSNDAYSWETALSNADDMSTAADFMELAFDYGLNSGMSYAKLASRSDNNFIITSFFSSVALDSWQQAYVSQVIAHVNELISRPSFWNDVKLSPRESEILNWSKEGKSYWEIASILNISERTVKFHLTNIYRKLNVTNRTQAIARSIQLGLISL